MALNHLQVLYRGPLASCNYRCAYCPFAKRKDSREALERDAASLDRFVAWAEGQQGRRSLSVLFTPWGEALIRLHYREAMIRLSRAPHVRGVAIQTNLSGPVDWMAGCDRGRAAFWCTFHPSETPLAAFVEKCRRMDGLGLKYSVGVVGRREHFAEIARLRKLLPAGVYLWVNALAGRTASPYTPGEAEFLASIDPLFELNLAGVRSLGRPCLAGETAIAVDGEGEARRCHFVPDRLGNIHSPDFDAALKPRPCPNAACVCHIGYAFMPELAFGELFGESLAHRIPLRPPTADDARALLRREGRGG
jgi:organic radical activating enzyme